jgi:hypothetical protein
MPHRNIRAAVRRRTARRDWIVGASLIAAATLAVALAALATSWLE